MNNHYFNLIRAVWHHGKLWRRTIIGYYCAYVIAEVGLSLGPYAFGRTIDVLQHFTPSKLHDVILWLNVGVLTLAIFWLFHGPARVKECEVALKIQQNFRLKMYEKLTLLSLKWHQDHHSGNTITQINRATTALYRFAKDQFIYIETIIKFLTSIGFLFWISWPVGLLRLVSGVLIVGIVIVFDRKLVPLYVAQNEIDNYVGATFFDYISNITTILTLRLGELTRTNLHRRLMAIWPFFRKDIVLTEFIVESNPVLILIS